MDIVNAFKNYLLTQKNPPSSITIKNYLSDIRKFISWYQLTFNQIFSPDELTSKIIAQYQSDIQSGDHLSLAAARSTKRYISSLRRFAAFLEDSGAIMINPFSVNQQKPIHTDPLFLNEFKSFLFTEHASKLTIKNYLVDIRQFLAWLERVTNTNATTDQIALLEKIDNYALEQYKTRLYTEAKLSPVSINRKLSSLRRYIRWLGEKGILSVATIEKEVEKSEPQIKEEPEQTINPIKKELPLIALKGLAEEKAEGKKHSYSPFGPIRLFQKTSRIITLGADLLFFNPITHSAEAIHYSLWKKGKKTIFAPVSTILESSSYIPKGVSIKTIIPKSVSIQPPRSANPASVIEKVIQLGATTNPDTVHNFTKALYAPLKISTKQMDLKERIWHQLRYARPAWYAKYHSLSFVTYFHYSIMIITMVIAGATIYQAWIGPTGTQTEAVLSAQAMAPPRTLSFQGRLLDKTNTPITAETPLRFALYNSPTATGAALLWEEKQDIKPDHSGYFSATLGQKARLDQSLFTDNPDLYLGISVNGNRELSPRQQIPTANYAASAKTVEGLKPITDTPDIAQNVLLALDSSGNLTIGGTESHTFQATGGQLSVSGQTLLLTTNAGTNGNIKIIPDGSGIIDLEKPLQNMSNYSSPGGVPGAVEVKDILSILATTSSRSALVINQNGTGDIISSQSNGIDKFSLDRQGNAFFAGSIVTKSDTIGTTSTILDIGGSNVKNLTLGENTSILSLGGKAGATSINGSISIYGPNVQGGSLIEAFGNLKADAGIIIPEGQSIVFKDFPAGAIPFIGGNNQMQADENNFSWNDDTKVLTVKGQFVNPHADLAENYVSSQNLEPGDLVVPEGQGNTMAIVRSTSPYQHQLIGIISTNPGVTLNSEASTDAQHPHMYPLALQGRVPVNVSSINGTIQAGDDLTSSSIPGVAMKATDSGQIIGKALESYSNSDPTAVGKIMVFVNLSYNTNPATITGTGNLAIATESALLSDNQTQTATPSALLQSINDTVSTIGLGFVKAQSITTQSFQVATDNIMIGGQTLKDYITTLVQQLVDREFDKRVAQLPQNQQLINPIASNSASTTDQSISPSTTPTPAGSNSAGLQLANIETASHSSDLSSSIYNSIASSSAAASPSAAQTSSEMIYSASDSGALGQNSTLQSETPNGAPSLQNPDMLNTDNNQYASIASLSSQLTYVPHLQSDYATFNQGLIALGPTSLTDVAVSSSISINNNLRITADSLDTVGTDLNIEPLRQGTIRFMGGLVAIDTQGNLQVNGNAHFAHNVTVNGQFAAGIIAPVPNQDLVINLKNKKDKSGSSLIVTSATGSGVFRVNQAGDVASSGEASFNTIASHGFTIIRGAEADTSMTRTVANSSAGNGVITAYETERTIITPYVTAHSLIYVTATSNTESATPYLARQTIEDPANGTQGSFTVAIPNAVTKDIGFNWWIVN
ncbi:MAG TPA: site-specific integrase [Candidatus Acidoferrales bacterium]|nr:site-specific integrase [Candidatus Acidoferrales bacterium]